MIFCRIVVVSLAGEEVGRFRIYLPGREAAGRTTPPHDADFIREAQLRFQMYGVSREDVERAEYRVELADI